MLPGLKDLRAAGTLLAKDAASADIERPAEHVWSALFHFPRLA